MTASFSTGFKEQVEYTNRPPTFNSSNPRFKMRNCILKTWIHDIYNNIT